MVMKRGILTIAAIIILMCASSCSSCNRTGQMIQWRDRGAVEAAQSLAAPESLTVNQ